MQQTMLRVKNPATSLDFYTRVLGMTSVISHFPPFLSFWGFSGINPTSSLQVLCEQPNASVFQPVAEDRLPIDALHPVLPWLRGKIGHPG